jgi:type IV pilus assembly protein PilM
MALRDTFARIARVEFAPPKYLSMPTAGIDISTSGLKLAMLHEREHGIELSAYGEERFELGVVSDGEITDRAVVVKGIVQLAKRHGVRFANIALPESRGYLFEADAVGVDAPAWRTSVEAHIDEFVPLPPAEVAFDVAPLTVRGTNAHLVGVGCAQKVVDELLASFDDAGITVNAIESETFALPRALLKHGDPETVLIIDIGRTSTKLLVVTNRLPRFATTLDIGGHALTLAVQKHFGVTGEEAKRVKAERGLVGGEGNEEYVAAMLSTVAAIREEIARRLDYWQTRATAVPDHSPVTRAILVGGNATVRGLPEYLETSLKVPVELGDVFTNLASRSDWLPPVDYIESLAYGTAIGLALRPYVP